MVSAMKMVGLFLLMSECRTSAATAQRRQSCGYSALKFTYIFLRLGIALTQVWNVLHKDGFCPYCLE
jgi:hypothetical protein